MSFIAPDWRDESQYATPETENDLGFWAWQFLRRNHEYQAEWSNYISDLQRVVESDAKWLPYLQRKSCLAEIAWGQVAPVVDEESKWPYLATPSMPIEFVSVDPAALPNERTVGEWSARLRATQGGGGTVQPREFTLGKRWGLAFIQNPKLETLHPRNRFINDGRSVRLVGDSNTNVADDNFWVPEIDLRYPVEVLRAQFELMLAEREQRIRKGMVIPYQGRPQRALQNYRNYLRVLDATDSGVGIPEIANEILSHQDVENAKKGIRNWYNAAEKIRNETYITLPVYQQIAFKR